MSVLSLEALYLVKHCEHALVSLWPIYSSIDVTCKLSGIWQAYKHVNTSESIFLTAVLDNISALKLIYLLAFLLSLSSAFYSEVENPVHLLRDLQDAVVRT